MLKTFVPLMAVLLLLLGTLSAAQQTSKPLDSSLMNSINQIPKCAVSQIVPFMYQGSTNARSYS